MKLIVCRPSSLSAASASEIETASVESEGHTTGPDEVAEVGWRIDGADADEGDATDVVDCNGVVLVGVDKGGFTGEVIDCKTLFGDSKMYLSLMPDWNARVFIKKMEPASYCGGKLSKNAKAHGSNFGQRGVNRAWNQYLCIQRQSICHDCHPSNLTAE